jgi:Uma2 family endonuclease
MLVQSSTEIVYPERDGNPMSDNTKQFRWIVTIKENLELIFAEDARVFVAGDLLWYPVEGNNNIRTAPDTMVVFGRPKGDRGSYRQSEEDSIPPRSYLRFYHPVIGWEK